ncbi:MAG: DUF898 family protein [Pikeienuella sp.]
MGKTVSWTGSGPDPAPFAFAPAPGEVQGLVLRDGALSALSFGVYRFWMKTHLRALIWRRTALAGDPFEYDGTPTELLRGALIAIVALSIGLLAFNLALAWAGLALWDSWSPGLSVVFSAAALAPVVEFARFAARRYRLRRTRWRGLRFGMDGAAATHLRIWLFWSLVMILTLGLARPWLRVARERYLTLSMLYGDARFGFEGRAHAIFREWLATWLAALVAFAAIVILRRVIVVVSVHGVRFDVMSFVTPLLALALGWMVFRFWCAYRAAELSLFMSARRVRGLRVSCAFAAEGLLRPARAVVGRAILGGAALAAMLIAFATLMLRLAVAAEGGDPADFALSVDLSLLGRFQTLPGRGLFLFTAWINYAATALFLMWLWEAIWRPRVHAALMAASAASGLESLSDIRQRPEERAIMAEGFADALDVAGL